MKKHYFIFLLFSVFLFSCESESFENGPNSIADLSDSNDPRLSNASLENNNTLFNNLYRYNTEPLTIGLSGEIYTPNGAEYTFISAGGGSENIEYEVYSPTIPYLHKITRSQQTVTIKIPKGTHTFRLTGKAKYKGEIIEARFVIDQIDGKSFSPINKGYYDLTILGTSE